MKVNIPILVYSKEAEDNDLLGLPIKEEYNIIVANIDTRYIIASYPDKEQGRTIFHLMGDIFTSSLSHEEFLEETLEEDK